MNIFKEQFSGKKVFVTGHTGFTGGWACTWLEMSGATVCGYALPPETNPSVFAALGVDRFVSSHFGDIMDHSSLAETMRRFEPDAVLHLAAQPLVRRSYREPETTFRVNAQGTVNVLEACRSTPSVRAIVCVTTDKVYRNNEWDWPYRECDPLGGKDPYSASKAAAEMAIQSYAASFFSKPGSARVAIARGGNIIGGGDWSEDRLVPDFVRALTTGSALTLRYPDATRPWQHVLALVQGYMMLLAQLMGEDSDRFARAWNFGRRDEIEYSVRDVIELLCDTWARPAGLVYESHPLPEARALALDSSLARNKLGWLPSWTTPQIVAATSAWYRQYYEAPDRAAEATRSQIERWQADATA